MERSFKIDAELKSLLDPNDDATRSELEKQLLDHGGARDPLVVWKEANVLVAGHHRLELCEKHGLPYKLVHLSFPSRTHVKIWMYEEQLGRRNLTPQRKAHFLTEKARLEVERGASATEAVKATAEVAGVSERTVYRAKSYTESLGSLPDDVRKQIVSGAIRASAATVIELAKASPSHQRALLHNVETGVYRSLHAALFGEDDPSPAKGAGQTFADTVSAKHKERKEKPEKEGKAQKLRTQSDASPAEVSPDEDDEGLNDHVRSSLATGKPATKPAMDLVAEAQKQLGIIKRAVDNLNAALPHYARYKECERLMDSCGRLLEEWKREAA